MKEGDLRLLSNLVNTFPSKLEKLKANVGIFEETASRLPIGGEESPQTNVEIGEKHEFGIGVPMRSFLRMPLGDTKELQNQFETYDPNPLIEEVCMGRAMPEALVEHLGFVGTKVVHSAFDTGGFGSWQPLSADTIAGKGGRTSILIDTEQLRKSITHQVV